VEFYRAGGRYSYGESSIFIGIETFSRLVIKISVRFTSLLHRKIPIFHKGFPRIFQKVLKNIKKRIDVFGVNGLRSARRHEQGGARDSKSIVVNNQIGFLVPSKQAL
jgi:hypothetical protein